MRKESRRKESSAPAPAAPAAGSADWPAEPRRQYCRVCPARLHTFCAPIPLAEIDRVALLKSRERVLPAGGTLYAEAGACGEYYTVLAGWVALIRTLADGTRVVLDFALPGDFVGFQAEAGGAADHTAVAVTASRLCPLPRPGAEGLIAAEPPIAAHLARIIAMHEARAHDHLVNSAARSAHERVAHLLIELYFRQRQHLPQARGETVPMPLTLALIGAAVGLTGEHVSRTLSRLRQEGIIRLHRRELTILDPAGLIRATGVEDHPLADAGWPDP